MKWFRHMSDASDDEFISEVEEIFGLDGYARWWKLLERIAKQMNETDKCYAEYSWTKWQSFLKGKRNKLETFLEHCQNKRRIKLELNGNILRIICPKLLELRDEYSRKSGHATDMTPDNVAPEEEVEEESKKKNLKKEKNEEEFSVFWKLFPRQRIGNQQKAEAAYRQALSRSTADEIFAGLKSYLDSDEVKRGFAKGAAAWLNDDRWKVQYQIITKSYEKHKEIRMGAATL